MAIGRLAPPAAHKNTPWRHAKPLEMHSHSAASSNEVARQCTRRAHLGALIIFQRGSPPPPPSNPGFRWVVAVGPWMFNRCWDRARAMARSAARAASPPACLLCDAPSLCCQDDLVKFDAPASCVAAASDGSFIVSGSQDTTLQVSPPDLNNSNRCVPAPSNLLPSPAAPHSPSQQSTSLLPSNEPQHPSTAFHESLQASTFLNSFVQPSRNLNPEQPS